MLNLSTDTIDVRDIIERVEELEELEPQSETEKWANHEEYMTLMANLEDLQSNSGNEQWRGNWYPTTLIRGDYFIEYMDQMLEDCGELSKNLPSYLSIVVDYKALQMDYTSIDIEDVTYWYR